MLVNLNTYTFGTSSIAHIQLHREAKANALCAEMISQFQGCLDTLKQESNCRLLILSAKGKHFSAGADLHWMQDSAKMSFSENVEDATTLKKLLETLAHLPIMTIALTHGAAYGGALGFLAACDYVISFPSAKFCLSEVRIGLLPAIIYPFLAAKIHRSALKYHALTAQVFDEHKALEIDLVDDIVKPDELNVHLLKVCQSVLATAPLSVADLKVLHSSLTTEPQDTAHIIATARTRAEGQEGLRCFFEKSSPNWQASISENDPQWRQLIETLTIPSQ